MKFSKCTFGLYSYLINASPMTYIYEFLLIPLTPPQPPPGPAVTSLQITGVELPRVVYSGDPVQLTCSYRLQGDSLYSLTWWKDEKQIYEYVPAMRSPKKEFKVPGIVVNVSI